MKTMTREGLRAEKKRERARIRARITPTNECWGTKDELRYLKHIGLHMKYPSEEPTRIARLRRYAKLCEIRTEWGAIDPQAIKDYLALELGVKA